MEKQFAQLLEKKLMLEMEDIHVGLFRYLYHIQQMF